MAAAALLQRSQNGLYSKFASRVLCSPVCLENLERLGFRSRGRQHRAPLDDAAHFSTSVAPTNEIFAEDGTQAMQTERPQSRARTSNAAKGLTSVPFIGQRQRCVVCQGAIEKNRELLVESHTHQRKARKMLEKVAGRLSSSFRERLLARREEEFPTNTSMLNFEIPLV